MTDTTETADEIRRLTAELERAREDLAFMGRNTLPELRREAEYQQEGKRRWRGRAKKAEARVAELAAASAVVPAADRAALRDRIAAAIWERQNPGRRWADCEHPWGADAEEDADAVLSVLPAPADRAAEEHGALKRAHVALAERAGRDQAALARVRRLHDALDAETDLTSPEQEITRGAAARKIAAALDGWTDPAEVRRLAVESAAVDWVAAETPQPGVQCSAVALKRPHGPHRWEPQPGMTPVRCPGTCRCAHPDDEHSVYGCADGCPCEYLPARRPAVEAQPGKDTETQQPKEA
jgi:hypothetical protein